MKKLLMLLSVAFMTLSALAGNELAPNQRLMGVYTSDTWNENGAAISNKKDTFQVFGIVPLSKYPRYADGKITAVRFALSNSCVVTKVFVKGVTINDDIVDLTETETGGKIFGKGWNTVTLNTPLSVNQPVDRLAFGFEYVEVTGAYPLSIIEGTSDEGFCFIGDLGQGAQPYNYSAQGMLSVQGVVTLENLPNLDVVLDNLVFSSTTVSAGSTLDYALQIYNFGNNDVTSYEIQVNLDGQLVETITEKEFTISHDAVYCMVSTPLPETLTRGIHTITAELVKVNGAAPQEGTADDKVSGTFSSYFTSDVVGRQKFLIEEMTSHSCTNCPLGASLLESMMRQYDDLAVACIHGNFQSKDPFNTEEHQNILKYVGIQGYPSATFNRNFFNDREGILPSIGVDGQQSAVAKELHGLLETMSIPAFASVDIEKSLSEDGNTLTITVSGEGGAEAKEVLKDYSLTVYVLEDSIKYRQLNSGTWVSNYIHNHVLRKVATAINGDDIKWTSSSAYENTYEVALDEAWVRGHLAIVAFISKRQPLNAPDWTDMSVSNANSVYLDENYGGGGNADVDDTRVDVGLKTTPFMESIQLMGEGMSPNGKYVAGQNYGTYAPCIWNVEDSVFTDFPAYEEGSVHAVSNDGIAVGTSHGYGGQALVCYPDGTAKTLNDNGGINTQGADAWCISEDGKTIGGFYYYFEWTNEEQTEGYFATFPCVWVDGVCTTLPYPSSKEVGFNVDGAGLRWMSADGSLLVGYLVDDKATWPAIIWRRTAVGSYRYDVICKDYFETSYKAGKPYMMFSPSALSPNGEWLVLRVQDEFDDSNFDNPIPSPKVARYNLKTKQLETLDGLDQVMGASAIANDGSVLLYTDIDGIFGRIGYVWPAGKTTVYCLDEMLEKVKDMPPFGANVPASFAADNSTIMGFGIDQDSNIFSYVVDLNRLCTTTGIENVQSAETKVKDTDAIYTITGLRVRDMKRPGLYIVNGKKYLAK